MAWRVASSLLVLRDQLNRAYPQRSKVSDGTIGDTAHSKTVSDHNPNHVGVVTAMDITHDPAHGVDIDKLSDALAASRDPRIKYVIANGLIMDSRPGKNPWKWVKYSGSNPHRKHMHVSVLAPLCDNMALWKLSIPVKPPPATPKPPPAKPLPPKPPATPPTPEKKDMSNNMENIEITQAVDVGIPPYKLPVIPGGTITRPFRWWLTAIYAHINAAENNIRDLEEQQNLIMLKLDRIIAQLGEEK